MKLIRVGCESCGGNLKVDPSQRFVTCGYCDASLEIVHDQSSVFSKVVAELVGVNKLLSMKLDFLETQNRLKKFDEDWEVTKESMSWRWKNESFVPNGVMAFCQSILLWFVGAIVLSQFELSVEMAVVFGGIAAAVFLEWRWRQIRRFRMVAGQMHSKRERIEGDLAELAQGLRDRGVAVAHSSSSSASIIPDSAEERYEDFF